MFAIIAAIIEAVGKIVAALIGVKREAPSNQPESQRDSEIVMYGAEVGIRVWDGRYVQSKLLDEEKAQLFALEHHVKAWELFEIASVSAPLSTTPNRPVRYGDKRCVTLRPVAFQGTV